MSWIPASVEDAFLARIAAPTGAPEIGGTARYTLANCLDFARKCYDDFDDELRDKRVVDFGCGFGWQAVMMAKTCGAKQVIGIDIVQTNLGAARRLAEKEGCTDRILFTDRLPENFAADVVVSLSAFEHFRDPARELRTMASMIEPRGKLLVAFAEPWYSPNGSHINGYTRLPFTGIGFPWLSLIVSDRALLKLRSRYRPDHPERIEDISGGLNKMTLAKFEMIVAESGLVVEQKRYIGVKGFQIFTKVPVVRELMTSAVSCIFRPARPI